MRFLLLVCIMTAVMAGKKKYGRGNVVPLTECGFNVSLKTPEANHDIAIVEAPEGISGDSIKVAIKTGTTFVPEANQDHGSSSLTGFHFGATTTCGVIAYESCEGLGSYTYGDRQEHRKRWEASGLDGATKKR